MTQPTGSIRDLQYPLNRSADLESDTPNVPAISFIDLSAWQTEDSDERVRIVLDLSLNEYVALASCVDVGRDIAYGDNSIYLWWTWVRSIVSMSICADVVDCIENDSDVQNAINNVVSLNSQSESRNYGQSQEDVILGSGNNPTCDVDVLWGGIDNLIESTNTQNEDILEQFEAFTNIYEFFADVVGNITVIDEASIDAILGWITYIQNNIAENYVAEVTQAYLDELKCDIFCLVKADCALTPQVLFDYFAGRLSGSISFDDLIETMLEFIVTGTWSGTQIADAFFLSNFMMRAGFGRLLDFVGFNSIDLDTRLGFLNPSNAWELLCDECPEMAVIEFDFTLSDGGWDVALGRGEWVDGVGWNTTEQGNNMRIAIGFDFASVLDIYKVEWDIDMTLANPAVNNAVSMYDKNPYNSVGSNLIAQRLDQTASVHTFVLEAEWSSDEIGYNGASGETQPNPANWGFMTITACRVYHLV